MSDKRVSRTQKIIDVAISLAPQVGVSEALRRALATVSCSEGSKKRACMIYGQLVAQAAEEIKKEQQEKLSKQKAKKNVGRKKTSKRK